MPHTYEGLIHDVPGLTGVLSAGVPNVTPLWALNFNVDASAPLPSPYSEDASTATLVQVDGQFSKSSGALQFPAQTTPVWGDQGLYRASTFTRAAGLVVVGKLNLSSGISTLLGYGSGISAGLSTVVDIAFITQSASLSLGNISFNVIVASVLSFATDYYLAVVALAAGSAFYIKGGTFANWTLLFHTNINTANLAPLFTNFSVAGALDYIHVSQIVASHALADGIIFTLNQATPAVNTNYAGEDDGITTLYYTLPAAPVLGDQVRLYYNYVDADNWWRILLEYDGAAWNITLQSDVATTITGHISVAAIGNTNSVRIVRRGNVHRLYTRNTSNVWTKRGGNITNSAHAGVTTSRVETTGLNWTLSQLAAAPSNHAAYAVLDGV